MAPTQDFVKVVIPKTETQAERIKVSIGNNFLFRNLDEEQYQDVVNAMAEKRVESGTIVIEQGAVGDFFYVVESGTLDCFISGNKVTNYEAGGSFGELALMYNAPRAATIVATSDCVLWALDRVTFRTILMENTSRKRRMYETFLSEVALLKSLEPYERHKIADALESVYFENGEEVVKQGDIGDQFYIIESGEAVVLKTDPSSGETKQVNKLERGSYFGELALLNDSPRAATVVAHGRLKCATLGKKAFTRLLGPVLDILKRNSENYHAIISQQS
ncbi:Putative cAMP-dependent protein kinase regulatory subunit [Rhizopus microsporus]|nr:Putative cAMP-dependent protein kinase regulatory subunit [Rhizopus microsporus]